jgi:glycosyltransferase involved in cell wall biosynthesis
VDSLAVSVIVPVYNAGKYLKECIKSIAAQTLPEIEIILVDDGSSDNSGKICEGYAGKDTRIRVVHQTNQGVSAARNLGIRLARGRYIGFVDADDWFAPEMFRTLYESAVRSNSQLVLCNYYRVKNNRFIIRDEFKNIEASDPQIKEKLIEGMLNPSESNILGSCCRALFLRELLTQNKIAFDEKENMMEDMAFTLQCVVCAKAVSIEHEPLYYYRVNPHSATKKYMDDIGADMMNVISRVQASLGVHSSSTIERAIQANIASLTATAAANVCKKGTPMCFWERVRYCGQLKAYPCVRLALKNTWKDKKMFQRTVWPQVVCMRLHLIWLVILYHSVKNRTLFQ